MACYLRKPTYGWYVILSNLGTLAQLFIAWYFSHMPRKKTEISDKAIQDLEVSLQEYEDEYLKPFVSDRPTGRVPSVDESESRKIDKTFNIAEREEVARFLSTPCPCGQNCQQFFSVSEVIDAREDFRLMSWNEQHSFIVGKLQTFMRSSEHSVSARRSSRRERQRFDYFTRNSHQMVTLD